ncbi:hypothetical protein THASP1DRAFT_31790 [Thamnocephalis sphaerospora]|uniref:Phospholipid/glycerol acyltransferase domain-containing protein n=1 Tax=Thamnocephalis sphaerospora TaxID=78915 RepID=A0A4P9XMB3_9FUNG|nr:hypothetical protein THASP1DRAFT_31790 [Thamnocephalis sphaerospora]|eukprot:RKP06390.1 hypothetical protein THASP1DRAFT_31790 [Thamnocephalis sphaerospora]
MSSNGKSAFVALTEELALWFLSMLVSVFFREIRTRGSYKIPLTGPVIFVVAPHANQFLDPIMVMRCVPRRVGFLCAQKTLDRKYVGALASTVNPIPVARPQDMARKGAGRIQLLDRYGEPTRITGTGTRFTSQLQVGWTVALPQSRGSAAVAEIVSDTELVVAKEFKDLGALELLTAPNGTSYKVMPHLDQSEVYRTVHERLTNGGCIGIFPEGGSHDRAEMLPLKAGVTVMALGAMAANPGLDVKIVPVGLNYFHPDRFRSRAVVEFGNVITVDPALVERFREGGTKKREACAKLLDTIYNSLKTVTINCPDYETLLTVQAARRLYQPPANRRLRDTARALRLQRRLVEGYMQVQDRPEVKALAERITEYNTLLSYYGLRDHQVQNTTLDGSRAAQLFFWRLVSLLFMAVLALPGLLVNLPLLLVASVISQRKAKQALAESSVKIKGRDVLATWKVLVALVLVPVIYALNVILSLALAIHWDWPLKWKIWAPVITLCCLPCISYMSILFGERGIDIYKSLRPLSLALLPFGRRQLQMLPTMRQELSRDITAVINELGPQVFPDFDPERIFRSSKTMSGERRNRYRRTSDDDSTGGVSSGAISGAATPGLISLRGWIKSPLELLDGTSFDWSSISERERDDVFFHGNSSSAATTPGVLSRNNSMSAAASNAFPFPATSANTLSSFTSGAETLTVPSSSLRHRHPPPSAATGDASDEETRQGQLASLSGSEEALYTIAAQVPVHTEATTGSTDDAADAKTPPPTE